MSTYLTITTTSAPLHISLMYSIGKIMMNTSMKGAESITQLKRTIAPLPEHPRNFSLNLNQLRDFNQQSTITTHPQTTPKPTQFPIIHPLILILPAIIFPQIITLQIDTNHQTHYRYKTNYRQQHSIATERAE